MKVAIAAGGTGGHVMPGIGLAEHGLKSGAFEQVLFVGARHGLEKDLVPAAGFELRTLPVDRVRGMGLATRVRGLAGFGLSIPGAARLLREFGADVVVGMGGYASAPALVAAALLRLPAVLCEQNTIPGSTNRALARFASTVCVSFTMSSGYLPSARVVVTGNPVRQVIVEARERRSVQPRGEGFRVLVLGGSQGALFLNRHLAPVLARFARKDAGVTIVHQAGARREAEAREAYVGLEARVDVRGYIDDVADELTRCDLVIGRAGATTVAELAAVGVPSLLVPFPFATDNHQYWNAVAMERAGAARIWEQEGFDGAVLLRALQELRAEPARLEEMERRARGLGHVDAAQRVTDVLRSLA